MPFQTSSSLALFLLRGFHFGGGGRGGSGFALLLVGLVFAGMLFWAVQRSRSTT
jgi:hypothetical protein